MAEFEVRITKDAAKELGRLPKTETRRILRRIDGLRHDPRPPGSEKLAGRDAYRIRQGDYRIIYTIDNHRIIVEVIRVGHRRDVYRN
jgi:mRNA interferase RelE/StbE